MRDSSKQKDPLEEYDKENQDSLFQDINDRETDFYFLSQVAETVDEMQLKNFTVQRLANLSEGIQSNFFQYGQPTVIKYSDIYKIIGTSCGVVCLFNQQSNYLGHKVLGESNLNKRGAVTAMDLVIIIYFRRGWGRGGERE